MPFLVRRGATSDAVFWAFKGCNGFKARSVFIGSTPLRSLSAFFGIVIIELSVNREPRANVVSSQTKAKLLKREEKASIHHSSNLDANPSIFHPSSEHMPQTQTLQERLGKASSPFDVAPSLKPCSLKKLQLWSMCFISRSSSSSPCLTCFSRHPRRRYCSRWTR